MWHSGWSRPAASRGIRLGIIGTAFAVSGGLTGRCDGGSEVAHAQNQQRRHQAGQAASDKCQQVIAARASYGAGAEGGQSTANLMTGEYPGEDHRRVAAAEDLVGERESRGTGSDPVQAIEDRKNGQADKVKLAEWHHDQRKTAQAVVPEQQGAGVEAIAQPAR